MLTEFQLLHQLHVPRLQVRYLDLLRIYPLDKFLVILVQCLIIRVLVGKLLVDTPRQHPNIKQVPQLPLDHSPFLSCFDICILPHHRTRPLQLQIHCLDSFQQILNRRFLRFYLPLQCLIQTNQLFTFSLQIFIKSIIFAKRCRVFPREERIDVGSALNLLHLQRIVALGRYMHRQKRP